MAGRLITSGKGQHRQASARRPSNGKTLIGYGRQPRGNNDRNKWLIPETEERRFKMPDPRNPNRDAPTPDPNWMPRPIEEPEPERLPDENPVPNPDENEEPPMHA
jgi:hypothetical protein